MKIGLDIHGVISKYPKFFLEFARMHLFWGNEIHIITGSPLEDAVKKLALLGFSRKDYTKIFSIVEYHKQQGTLMWKNKKGGWEMNEEVWWKTKSLYWRQEGIDLHYDDSEKYNINNIKTKFVLVK